MAAGWTGPLAQSQDNGPDQYFLIQPGKPDSKTKFSFNEFIRLPRASPNGRWLAFISGRSGQAEVWVQLIAGAGPPQRITTNGAQSVAWSPTGKELYLARPPDILTVPLREDRDRFVIGHERLFARVRTASQ